MVQGLKVDDGFLIPRLLFLPQLVQAQDDHTLFP